MMSLEMLFTKSAKLNEALTNKPSWVAACTAFPELLLPLLLLLLLIDAEVVVVLGDRPAKNKLGSKVYHHTIRPTESPVATS